MITCQDARQLFDRYLDGELSASLRAELHAHQLNCPSCQNELAMLEACGDVIALDRREPLISDSFTDRVLLARRAQRTPSRRWRKIALFVGSPMAAAASIVLAVMLFMPPAQESKKTITASRQEAVPEPSRKLLMGISGKKEMSQQARQELEDTPQVPAVGWMETLLARVVDQAQDSLQGTRASLEELNLLLHMGFSDTNEKLAALLQSKEEASSGEAPAEHPTFDPWDPAYSNPNPPADSKIDSVPEAL